MQVSSPPSQVVIQKYGFLIMAPIALVMHGLFLLIPMGQEQKAKEPEKKEEILSIGSIAQLPSGQVPSTALSATPKPSTSAAPIVQQQQNPAPVPIVPQQPVNPQSVPPSNSSPSPNPSSSPNPSPSPVSSPTSSPSPVSSPPAVPMAVNVLNDLPGTKKCSSNTQGCVQIRSQAEARQALQNLYKEVAIDIENELSEDEKKPTIGFKIRNQKGEMEYFYFVGAIQIQMASKEFTVDQLIANKII